MLYVVKCSSKATYFSNPASAAAFMVQKAIEQDADTTTPKGLTCLCIEMYETTTEPYVFIGRQVLDNLDSYMADHALRKEDVQKDPSRVFDAIIVITV